jgi:hypothetical protein
MYKSAKIFAKIEEKSAERIKKITLSYYLLTISPIKE